jgi:hypothetical protein
MRSILKMPWNLIISKIHYKLYFAFFSKRPWVNRSSYKKLLDITNSSSVVAEYGAGKSTYFFASKVFKLYSIETSKLWFDNVSLKISSFNNTVLEYFNHNQNDVVSYARSLDNICKEKLDLLFIDAYDRNLCIEYQWQRVKIGGYLVIDDYHRYFKFQSKYGKILSHETTRLDYEKSENILKENFDIKVFESGGFSTAFCIRIK